MNITPEMPYAGVGTPECVILIYPSRNE